MVLLVIAAVLTHCCVCLSKAKDSHWDHDSTQELPNPSSSSQQDGHNLAGFDSLTTFDNTNTDRTTKAVTPTAGPVVAATKMEQQQHENASRVMESMRLPLHKEIDVDEAARRLAAAGGAGGHFLLGSRSAGRGSRPSHALSMRAGGTNHHWLIELVPDRAVLIDGETGTLPGAV